MTPKIWARIQGPTTLPRPEMSTNPKLRNLQTKKYIAANKVNRVSLGLVLVIHERTNRIAQWPRRFLVEQRFRTGQKYKSMEKKELEVLLLCQLISKMNQLESKTISGKLLITRNDRFTEIVGILDLSKFSICRYLRFVEILDLSKFPILQKYAGFFYWPRIDEIFRRDSEIDDLHPPKRSRDDLKSKKNQNRQPSKGRTKEPNLRNELEAPNVPVLKDWKKMEEDEHPQESCVDSPKMKIPRKTRFFENCDSSKNSFFFGSIDEPKI